MTDTPPSSSGADDQPPPHHSPYGQAPGAAPPPGYEPPPGYGPPPGQPYDPSWGYGPPGGPYGPQRGGSSDDTTMALISYLLMCVTGFIGPLVIYLIKRNESPFVRYHAAQALNYQISLLLRALALAAVCVPAALLADQPALFIPLGVVYLEAVFGPWVFGVIGAVKAGKGQYVRFPTFFCFRMVR
ncbi:DUF4870 domain-containing protein [Actinomadura hibisca]|uniref:DUF4870 domain-containing protein n=1 Tax=Actinomadura hibisca TaxID=68565 RepID=UPI00083257C1|nr:DUF4870 domain-containing protein [Actinomadura hibisca]